MAERDPDGQEAQGIGSGRVWKVPGKARRPAWASSGRRKVQRRRGGGRAAARALPPGGTR